MLIDFTVCNFRSIKEPLTLSLLATKIREHSGNVARSKREKSIKLLKVAGVYGANASGKSNLIKALDAFRNFIVGSTDLKLGEVIPYYDPFKLERDWPRKPSMFEMEFSGENDIRYRYGVTFNNEEIIKENLVFFPKGQEANLFLREKGKNIKFGDYFKGPAKTIENQLLRNNLFLSKAANSNHKFLERIYLFFRDALRLSTPAPRGPIFPNFTTRECVKDGSYINKTIIGDFLKIADTGIEHMDIDKKAISENEIPLPDAIPMKLKKRIIEEVMLRPRMFHGVFDNGVEIDEIGFDIEEESNGTIKLYELAGKILHVLKIGAVFIADELNNSLHPHMMRFIVDLFHDPATNPNNAQLIFATHDATLLNPEIFRRDQIWLTEKDRRGATSLFSLSEFDYKKVRSHTPYDKWYLSGRFGALPLIGEFRSRMQNA